MNVHILSVKPYFSSGRRERCRFNMYKIKDVFMLLFGHGTTTYEVKSSLHCDHQSYHIATLRKLLHKKNNHKNTNKTTLKNDVTK